MMQFSRRRLIGSLIAAPALVRFEILMPVKAFKLTIGPPLIIKDGWITPNGAEVSRLAYPDLFAVIGTNYGAQSSETFTLPSIANHIMKHEGNLAGMLCFALENLNETLHPTPTSPQDL